MEAIATWWIVALAASLVVVAVGSRLESVQTWQVARLAKRVGLGVPVDLELELRARVARRLLDSALGGLIGLAAAVAVIVATDDQHSGIDLYSAAAAMIAGHAAGLAWASFTSVFEKDSRPRIARLTHLTLGSYVPTSARILAWLLLALAIATVLVDTGWQNPERAWVLAPLLGVSALSLVALEVLGRLLVTRGQAATTTDELVWDDALRSSSLNEAVYGTQQTLLFALLGCAALSLASDEYWVLIPGGLLAIGLVLLAAMIRQSRTWYLDELWPGSRRRTAEEEAARSTSRA